MELVAFLGSDKESWGQVSALINHGEWTKIILIRSSNSPEYPVPSQAEEVIVDTSKSILDLKAELLAKLKGSFSEFEACLSIASGNGKEHMALIASLLSIPVGIRLVAFTKKGVEFIN